MREQYPCSHPDRKVYARGACKPCWQGARARAAKEADPEGYARMRKDAALRSQFGITLAQYEEMYEDQQGMCDICQTKEDVLHVDHDHETCRVRSLLCGKCNRGLGMFKDNPELLSAAANYLRFWSLAK